MIQFGASTFIWVSPFSTNDFDLLYKVADMGYDLIEVAVEDKDIIDWTRLKKIARETGLSITISGAFGPNGYFQRRCGYPKKRVKLHY